MPYIVVFSFSVALDAITGEVKLQFVIPSNILFMFSFAKMVFCYTCLQLSFSLLASSSLCVSLLIMYVSLRVCVSCYSVCVCVCACICASCLISLVNVSACVRVYVLYVCVCEQYCSRSIQSCFQPSAGISGDDMTLAWCDL